MDDPCKYCGDYPHHCRGICIAKQMYTNEVDEETPFIRKHKEKKNSSIATVFYRDGKQYEYNKNGIPREVRR